MKFNNRRGPGRPRRPNLSLLTCKLCLASHEAKMTMTATQSGRLLCIPADYRLFHWPSAPINKQCHCSRSETATDRESSRAGPCLPFLRLIRTAPARLCLAQPRPLAPVAAARLEDRLEFRPAGSQWRPAHNGQSGAAQSLAGHNASGASDNGRPPVAGRRK